MNAKKVSLIAMLTALCFVFAWVEAQIPALIAVPGVKLGLTNLVVLVALYQLGTKEAIIINFVRIILVGFTFGNLYSMWYALAGGLLATAGMIIFKNVIKARIVTVSIIGGLLHNLGQILVAMIVLQTDALLYYLVILWITGSVAGCLIGLIGAGVVSRLRRS